MPFITTHPSRSARVHSVIAAEMIAATPASDIHHAGPPADPDRPHFRGPCRARLAGFLTDRFFRYVTASFSRANLRLSA
jgi:hypothetical protein